MKSLVGLVCGLVFGVGLIVSAMVNPAKIQNFLDIFGAWDPSLALVMAGAIAVTLPGYKLAQLRAVPFFHDVFHLPTRQELDKRLLAGAVMFGIGWGLSGYCPGPAITALPLGAGGTIVFFAAMMIGMWVARMTEIEAGAAVGAAR